MLVLSRRINEAVIIGRDIEVHVLGVEKNGQVKLGIKAPRSLRILRQELLEQVCAVNRAALAQGQGTLDLDLLQGMVGRPSAIQAVSQPDERRSPGPQD